MLTIKNIGSTVIIAASLLSPLTGNSKENAAFDTLYTPPIAGGLGQVDCSIVNVGKQALNVTTTYFDNAGNIVGSGEQTISPGGTGGASFGAQDGYCQWIVEGSATNVRAAGRVFHFANGVTLPNVDVYPAN